LLLVLINSLNSNEFNAVSRLKNTFSYSGEKDAGDKKEKDKKKGA